MLNADDSQRHELTDGFNAVLAGGRNTVLRFNGGGDQILDFARSVAAGLEKHPRRLECRFLYDARGSELYERITRQPEYYPTRTEAAILRRHAGRIRSLAGPVNLLELGSGNSEKTDHLLRAWLAGDSKVCYIPVDVSESALLQANQAISERHPRVRVVGVHSTYEMAFHLLPAASPVMVIFLGSTIGNFEESEEEFFFRRLSGRLSTGDFLLLGVDLVKDAAVLEAAYNDAGGITAEFTLNLFARMNRELGAELDLSSIHHLARWRPEGRRIEIHAGFSRPQTIRISPLGRCFQVSAGEEVLIEISRKFVLPELTARLAEFGFQPEEVFTDDDRWFALLLLRKTGGARRAGS